ncbi:uncharacterized protein LOC122504328 [Leptopilina heterotoma]|uniref:uncharacterized protein LOC122504328 n=1 Tax=Leptopilina heterotoma TaxID=63436 RepID=UPI001CA86D97|nr:uncharacterized protein LOC122504328 [Leptopilina heterotoma]
MKASIVERFNRTLKRKMWMQFSLRGNYKWYDILPTLISNYNNTKHRTIGMKPKDVTSEDVEILKERISKLRKIPLRRPKYKIGDKVRVSKYKNVFEKGYTPNWTTEIFTVDQVVSTQPVTYKLKDYQDQPISGGFYEEELLKVKYSDIYLVEKFSRHVETKFLSNGLALIILTIRGKIKQMYNLLFAIVPSNLTQMSINQQINQRLMLA